MPARRTRNSLIRAVPELPPDRRFAQCRSMGHEWHHAAPVGSDNAGRFRVPFGMSTGMLGFPSTCTVCGTERMRWLTRSGDYVVRYEHPEGYSRHGEERMSPLDWRRTFVTAVFDDFEQRATS